jgi:fibronectin type 3 domain-containing protein
MKVTIVGNFGVTEDKILPSFQKTGTWYDYFSGKAIQVSTDTELTLAPGEFHIFTDKAVAFPEPGLVETSAPIIIAVPANLTAQAQDAASVKLSWEDTSSEETGFVIERKSEKQSSFATLVTLPADATSYTDAQIVDGVTYEYRVKTISSVKPHSDWSNIAQVDLLLVAPAGLKATATGLRSVALSWEDRSANETGYVVEKATQNGKNITAFSVIAELKANATTFTDTKVQPGQQHYYRVLARDNDETSAYSNQVSIRTTDDLLRNLQDILKKSIILFPNPASGVVTVSASIQLTEPLKIQIANMQGVIVKTLDFAPYTPLSMQLNISGWREGVYVVQITYQNIMVRQLLMIKR